MTTEIIVRADAHHDLIRPAIERGINAIARQKIQQGERAVFVAHPHTFVREGTMLTVTIGKVREGIADATASDGEPFAIFL